MAGLFRYFKPADRPPTLPKPTDKSHGLEPAAVRSANEKVQEVIDEENSNASTSGNAPGGKKRRRGQYTFYDGELRAKIGRYAAENGDAAACRKFSKELKKTLNESTVRGMRNAYIKNKAVNTETEVTSLPIRQRGRPCLLGKEHDDKVKNFVIAVRRSGGSVGTKLLIAAVLKDCFGMSHLPFYLSMEDPSPWTRPGPDLCWTGWVTQRERRQKV